MGVPAELLGKQVRCPHCKQVVLAPVTVAPAPAPAPAAAAPPAPTPGYVPPPAPAPAPIPAPAPQPIFIASPPPAPPPAPAPLPPAPAAEPDLPVFNIPQRKEGADSIMSEENESDDEVFGSQSGGRIQALQPMDLTSPGAEPPAPVVTAYSPPAPAPLPAPPPAPAPMPSANPFAFESAPVAPPAPPAPIPAPAPPAAAAPPPAPAPIPAPFPAPPAPLPVAAQPATGANPFADLEPVSLPGAFVLPAQPPKAPPPAPLPVPQPVAAPAPAPLPVRPVAVPPPAPAPVPVAQAPAGGNPFADFDDAPTAAPSATVPVAPQPLPVAAAEELPAEDDRPRKRKKEERDDRDRDQPEEKPARAARGRGAPAGPGGGNNLVILVILGGYAVLATALALYGLFFKSGDKVETGHPLSTIPDNFGEFDPATRKKVTLYKFPVDGELPAEQRAALGGTVAVGEIEVTPLRIERRKLAIDTETTRGETRREFSPSAAFVLTMSIKNNSGMSFHPMDPAFTRKSVGDDRPITRLVVNKQTVFAGGFISWPLDPNKLKKRIEVQQENDSKPLAPSEVREYVVFTDANPNILKTVENAKEPMQWRVQVRRAPITYRGKEVPVTAIVGVDFKASDVKSD